MSAMFEALGLVETRGYVAMVEAADAMLKCGRVELVGYESSGGGFVTVVVRGDVASIKLAIDTGARAAEKVGQLISAHVLPRPHSGIDSILPKDRTAPRISAAHADFASFPSKGLQG
jgi:ethanolamine utilization protein EutM